MTNPIRVKVGPYDLAVETFTFPGGELSVKIVDEGKKVERYIGDGAGIEPIRIHFRPQNASDVFLLALVKNALDNYVLQFISRHMRRIDIELFMPYIPYARQDRVCNEGEAFSLKVFASFINSLQFSHIWVVDPHSAVSSALLDRVSILSQVEVVQHFPVLMKRLTDRSNPVCIVSPDAGATKKTADIAKMLGALTFIRGEKIRNLSTGKIVETIVSVNDFNGSDVVIFDDIIDGGATFLALAAKCKEKGASKVILYGTHGIFSKSIESLLTGGVDEIYTTNSFKEQTETHPNFFVHNIL